MFCPVMLKSRATQGEYNDLMTYNNEQCLKGNCAWWLGNRECCAINAIGKVAGEITAHNAIGNWVSH